MRDLPCYLEYGDKNGIPFFYFHGLPGSRVEGVLLDAAASKLNIRVIAVERPGYGRTPPQGHRSLSDWTKQISALADQLGLNRFGVIGISGGGPYALACAHYLPQRLNKVGVVCGLGPLTTSNLLPTMNWYARHVFGLAQKDGWFLLKLYGFILTQVANLTPHLLLWLIATIHGGADKRVLQQPAVITALTANLRAAFAQGDAGVLSDLRVYAQPWGFDLGEITLPVQFWHGDRDPIVPLRHTQYAHAQIKTSTLNVIPGEGHFSLPIEHAESILRQLAL